MRIKFLLLIFGLIIANIAIATVSADSNGDPGPGGMAVTGNGAEVWLLWQGGVGATGYNIYRAVGVNDFNQAQLIASNIPAIDTFPNPYSASLPDNAKLNTYYSNLYSTPYYAWDDLTAAQWQFNYYWIESVGTGTGPKQLFPGIRKSVFLFLIPYGNGSSGTVTIPYGGSVTFEAQFSPGFTDCQKSGPWSGSLPLFYDTANPASDQYKVSRYKASGQIQGAVYGRETINNITSSGNYWLTCWTPRDVNNTRHGQSASLQVNVTPPASATVDISASDTEIPYNTSTTLNWSYSNATSCTITAPGTVGSYPSDSGSASTGDLTGGRTYTITCNPGSATDDVTVNVEPQPSGVTVIKGGKGSVVSSPAGINCPHSCTSQSATFDNGSSLTLTATPSPGRIFTGWQGVTCNGGDQKNPVCTFTLSSDVSITVNFAVDPRFKEF